MVIPYTRESVRLTGRWARLPPPECNALTLAYQNDVAVFAVSAFRGTHRETLAALIPEYNGANGCRVHFINASEWIPPEPLHPHRDGHVTVAAHLAPVIREILKNEKKDR